MQRGQQPPDPVPSVSFDDAEVSMHTEIYESDPFTARRGTHLGSLDSDYRFERNDEFFLKVGSGQHKYRVILVRLEIDGGQVRRELHVLKI